MITAIYASHREGGNTDKMLDIFTDQLNNKTEIKKIKLINYNLNLCKACLDCHQDSKCILNDDIITLYNDIDQADGILISSPIYFASVTSALKILIDRAEPYRAKYVLNDQASSKIKPGFFLGAGSYQTDIFYKNAKEIIINYFHSLNTEYFDDLFFKGLKEKDDLSKVDFYEEKIRQAANRYYNSFNLWGGEKLNG